MSQYTGRVLPISWRRAVLSPSRNCLTPEPQSVVTELGNRNQEAALTENMTLTERLVALWDHLGLDAPRVATQLPNDLAGFVQSCAKRIGGLAVCEASGVAAASFRPIAERLTFIAGDSGLAGKAADQAMPLLPGSRRVVLRGYGAPVWADCVSDHTAAFVEALSDLPGRDASGPVVPTEGQHAGITYRIQGRGPALVLFPLFLSAAQWSAALPSLMERFTLILLGGPYLGGVAVLEDRAKSPSYAGMVRTVLDLLAPRAGGKVLDVGCGSGALTRLAANRFGPEVQVTGVDLNAYLLREAAAIARHEGLAEHLVFEKGNAEDLPYSDASFDHAFSVTVLEECDAARALTELRRVVKPGGRLGVVVRAIDMAHPWHLELPDTLRRKVDDAPALVGPRGVADHTIYRRMAAAGFAQLICFPMLASFSNIGGPFWAYLESRVLARLSAEEAAVFHNAAEAERQAGTFFVTSPHHCVVGTNPKP